MNIKHIGKKGAFTAAIALAMLTGAAGATMYNASHQANAQTATPTPVTSNTTTPAATSGSNVDNGVPNNGTFHSNEDPAHEATESPQREAQENAGQFPTVK